MLIELYPVERFPRNKYFMRVLALTPGPIIPNQQFHRDVAQSSINHYLRRSARIRRDQVAYAIDGA